METNNLTPDENLKSPTGCNPNKDYNEIIHPDSRPDSDGIDDDEIIIYGDPMSDEEIEAAGGIIVFTFVALLLVILALLFISIFQL